MTSRADPATQADRSWECPLLHVDMDAFYVSVALRDRPDLRDLPVVVGAGHRGVVLAAGYPARARGVRAGMSGTEARARCPDLVALPPDGAAFGSVSAAVIDTFRQVTPLVEVVSLDEAFLDVSGAGRRLGSPRAVAEHLRARIHDEQRITCSVGVAASVSVAKVASRRAKPDGVVVVPPGEVAAWLRPLDVGELWGVGPSTSVRLHRLGLRTVGDIAATPEPVLRRLLGRHLGAHLHRLAHGADRTALVPREAPAFSPLGGGGAARPDRSVGAQTTLRRDTADRDEIGRTLLSLTVGVCRRLRAAGLVARTVVITVRRADFATLTRSRSLPEPTDATAEVFAVAGALYDGLGLRGTRLRLLGVRVSGLVDRDRVHRQHVLGERGPGWRAADRAVDAAVERFGRDVVGPATLLRGGGDRRRGPAGRDAAGPRPERTTARRPGS